LEIKSEHFNEQKRQKTPSFAFSPVNGLPAHHHTKAVTGLSCCAPVFFRHTFCVVFASAPQHIYFFQMKTGAHKKPFEKNKRAVPTPEKTKQKAACAPTATTAPAYAKKKRGKLFNIKSLPL
jgi:hypothetical protein